MAQRGHTHASLNTYISVNDNLASTDTTALTSCLLYVLAAGCHAGENGRPPSSAPTEAKRGRCMITQPNVCLPMATTLAVCNSSQLANYSTFILDLSFLYRCIFLAITRTHSFRVDSEFDCRLFHCATAVPFTVLQGTAVFACQPCNSSYPHYVRARTPSNPTKGMHTHSQYI